MKNISIKRHSGLLAAFLLLMSIMLVCSSALVARADYSVSSDEVNIVTKADTGYKVRIGLTGVNGYMVDTKNATVMAPFGGSYWKRSDVYHTVIMRFNNLKYTDPNTQETLSTLIIGIASISQPSHWSFNKRFTFNSDIEVRTTLAYYNLMQSQPQNLSSISLTLYVDGKGYKLETDNDSFTFNLSVNFFTYDKKPGEDDPESPDFNPEGAGGMDATGTNETQSAWYSFYLFLADLGLPISYKTFNILALVLGGILVLAIVSAIIARIRGK